MSARFQSLAHLLAEGRDPQHPVARDGSGTLNFGSFVERVAALWGAFSRNRIANGRWLVVTSSSADLAAALLAIWHADGVAVLPPNAQPATLAELAQGADGIVSDAAGLPVGLHVVRPVAAVADGAGFRGLFGDLDPTRPCLELLTSGSTSARKRCSKTLSQLDSELAALEAAFGSEVAGVAALGSVSHQHLYGLVFRVLWPLAAGRLFHARALLHAEEIAASLSADGLQAILVSVPAHLRRLAQRQTITTLAPLLRDVFSSGGPLDEETADAFAAALGRPPTEIYGSTETGAVSWRRRGGRQVDVGFTPLRGVQIDVEASTKLLVIKSPFASPLPEPEPVRTADRVELLSTGGFILLGRSDRVVKIAEKAVSLPELEEHLCEHPWIEAAACVRLERTGEPRIGAVVVANEIGRAALARDGRLEFGRALAAHLASRWDRILLPRAWRIVDALPLDEQGKVPAAALQALFAASAAERPRVPEILSEKRGPDAVERVLCVPRDLVLLDGHFPDSPIVPGIAQLQWAFAAAREVLGITAPARRIEQLKFRNPLLPGQRLILRVEREIGAEAFRFQLADGDRVFSSGRVVFGLVEGAGV